MPNSINCARGDSDCSQCDMNIDGDCYQDPDLGGTGHGDMSFSDADPGM